MQKSASLPLRRLAQASKLPQTSSARPFTTSEIRPKRLYQCISPLSSRPWRSLSRTKRSQWQPIRNVYTTRGSTLRERVAELRKENPIMFPLALLRYMMLLLEYSRGANNYRSASLSAPAALSIPHGTISTSSGQSTTPILKTSRPS